MDEENEGLTRVQNEIVENRMSKQSDSVHASRGGPERQAIDSASMPYTVRALENTRRSFGFGLQAAIGVGAETTGARRPSPCASRTYGMSYARSPRSAPSRSWTGDWCARARGSISPKRSFSRRVRTRRPPSSRGLARRRTLASGATPKRRTELPLSSASDPRVRHRASRASRTSWCAR